MITDAQADNIPETSAGKNGAVAATLLDDLGPGDWNAARQAVDVAANEVPCNIHEVGTAKPLNWHKGFEMSPEDITANGLDGKVAEYKAKIVEAMQKLNASYKIDLRVIDRQTMGPHGTPTDSDVWTEPVRNSDMRDESYVINVTAKFLRDQPEILFESSSLHEIAHIMNDDLPGYHRQGGNSEMAEERRVADAVGMPRYEEYLRAYTQYNPKVKFDTVLQKVKDLTLVPPPVEMDDADKRAAEYFRTHADGKERLVVDNGQLHDISSYSGSGSVEYDQAKLDAVIKAGKPMIFFHNHPSDGGTPAKFPSFADFGAAARQSFEVFKQNPNLPVEFRVMQLNNDDVSNVSYGFKRPVIDDIKRNAEAYRTTLEKNGDAAAVAMRQRIFGYHLANDSYNEYLKHAYLLEAVRANKEACRVNPQYFLWPSDRFFVHDRPQSLEPSKP